MKFDFSRVVLGAYLLANALSLGAIALCLLIESSILDLDAIFRMNSYTETLITRYDQGLIMSVIWSKLYYIFFISAIVIFAYETLSFRFKRSSFFIWILNVLNSILMMLFCLFYLPGIARIFGNEPKVAATPKSESLLNQSELVLQLLCFTLLLTFFIRLLLLSRR